MAHYSRYITNCVNANGDEIQDMQDLAINVSYRTFSERLGRAAMKELERALGYDAGLRLKNDWAVSFHRSEFRGERVYYLQHSHIEYIYGLPVPGEAYEAR